MLISVRTKKVNCSTVVWLLNQDTKVIVSNGVSFYLRFELIDWAPEAFSINHETSSLVNYSDLYGDVDVCLGGSLINNGRVARVKGEYENNGGYCAYINWADDGSSFSAYVNGSTNSYNEGDDGSSVTSVVTKEPTCTEHGVRTFTGTFHYDGQEFSDTKEVEIAINPDAHIRTEGICDNCGYECKHKEQDSNGDCTLCGYHIPTFASLEALIENADNYDAVNVAIDEVIVVAMPHPDPDLSGMYAVALKSGVQLLAPIPEPALEWQAGGRITGTLKCTVWDRVDIMLISKDADFWSNLEYTAPAQVDPIAFNSIDELFATDLENGTPVTVTF